MAPQWYDDVLEMPLVVGAAAMAAAAVCLALAAVRCCCLRRRRRKGSPNNQDVVGLRARAALVEEPAQPLTSEHVDLEVGSGSSAAAAQSQEERQGGGSMIAARHASPLRSGGLVEDVSWSQGLSRLGAADGCWSCGPQKAAMIRGGKVRWSDGRSATLWESQGDRAFMLVPQAGAPPRRALLDGDRLRLDGGEVWARGGPEAQGELAHRHGLGWFCARSGVVLVLDAVDAQATLDARRARGWATFSR